MRQSSCPRWLTRCLVLLFAHIPALAGEKPSRSEAIFAQAANQAIGVAILDLPASKIPYKCTLKLWLNADGGVAKVEAFDTAQKSLAAPEFFAALRKAKFPTPPPSIPQPLTINWVGPQDPGRPIPGSFHADFEKQFDSVAKELPDGTLPSKSLFKVWLNSQGRMTKIQILDSSQKPLDIPKFVERLKKTQFPLPPARLPMPLVFIGATDEPANYPDLISRQVHSAIAGLPRETLPPVFLLNLWIDAGGRPTKAQATDIFQNPLKNQSLIEALEHGSYEPPPPGLPMPINIKIKVKHDEASTPNTESKILCASASSW